MIMILNTQQSLANNMMRQLIKSSGCIAFYLGCRLCSPRKTKTLIFFNCFHKKNKKKRLHTTSLPFSEYQLITKVKHQVTVLH